MMMALLPMLEFLHPTGVVIDGRQDLEHRHEVALGEDIHGKLVGPGDLATQARQVFGNLGRALAAADARPAQVTRITIYVVNYKRDECLPIIEKARIALFGDHKPADVVLGVATLSPDYLIEVDAIAIID
jgi:enamine deaminase RidA (YjgF/YER057c/UK114 family)